MDRPTITMEQLLQMTTVSRCTSCWQNHAPVRGCEQAAPRCDKHQYECLGFRKHKHRPRIRFRCRNCPDVIEVPRQTVHALVKGEAKKLRLSRIHHPKV